MQAVYFIASSKDVQHDFWGFILVCYFPMTRYINKY